MPDDSTRTNRQNGTRGSTGITVVRKRRSGWLIALMLLTAVIAGVYFSQSGAGEDALASGADSISRPSPGLASPSSGSSAVSDVGGGAVTRTVGDADQ